MKSEIKIESDGLRRFLMGRFWLMKVRKNWELKNVGFGTLSIACQSSGVAIVLCY